ncbi:dnaJ homolog subfamily C member 17 isoform X2 [Hippocampus zosterae]|uniref:dnaJ homolog subfamily C member 17 isoform X2 n=1 Tax=Hippocampus zosterae TaxID=109293 RepID=UPI00223CB6CB|nr:dnaJ homolog subfamily C member 17 isoform X2 [Hippocampus zosterae]
MSGKAKDILQLDLYGLLGIENTATTKEIKKAYRQKALKCHPDKNPDNPKAAELFHQLSQALEVLTDAAAKAAYDKVRAAKKQAEERNRKLDDKRKKIKLDLEARERQAEAEKEKNEIQITRTLEEEIIRLREEGSRQLEEEQRLIREQIQREREEQQNTGDYSHRNSGGGRCSRSSVTPKLKLKWKCKNDDDTNGGYCQEFILKLLQKVIKQCQERYEEMCASHATCAPPYASIPHMAIAAHMPPRNEDRASVTDVKLWKKAFEFLLSTHSLQKKPRWDGPVG